MNKYKIFLILFIVILITMINLNYGLCQNKGYNSYQYIIGDRAAGMAGAFTALANDSTSLWYNPAGLAEIKTSNLNISGNTYSFLTSKKKGLFEIENNNNEYDKINYTESDFSIVATSLAFGFNLGKIGKMNHSFAIGLFVPESSNLKSTIVGDAETDNIYLDLNYQNKLSSKYYVAMIGYGIAINNDFNLGIAIGLGYADYMNSTTNASYAINKNTGKQSSKINTTTSTLNALTINGCIGVQYYINRNHKLGISFYTASFKFDGGSTVDTINSSNTDGEDLNYSRNRIKKDLSGFEKLKPSYSNIGYAYINPNNWTFSIDLIPVLKNADENDENITNFKIGFEYYLSNDIILRTGIFTDYSPNSEVKTNSTVTEKTNYFGSTLSFSYKTEFRITEDDSTLLKDLWSTFGLMFKYGSGEFIATRYDNNFNAEPIIKNHTSFNIGAFISESMSF